MDELLQLLMQQGQQIDPYGAQPNVVGPRGYARGTAAPLPFPQDQPTPPMPQETPGPTPQRGMPQESINALIRLMMQGAQQP